ncbi:phospholipase-like protein [Tanacetum coccineum]
MCGQDNENEKDTLVAILKSLVGECKAVYATKGAQIETSSDGTNEVQGMYFAADYDIQNEEGVILGALPFQLPPKELNPGSFTLPCTIAEVAQEEDDVPTKVLPCQLPPKELNLGSFTLPCTVGKLNFYAMADLGASINVIPKSMFEHLKLANLKKTDMLVEMADMAKRVRDAQGNDLIWDNRGLQTSTEGLSLQGMVTDKGLLGADMAMIGREILVVGSHIISHGLPAWQSVIETACASFESVTSVNSHLSCAFLSFNVSFFTWDWPIGFSQQGNGIRGHINSYSCGKNKSVGGITTSVTPQKGNNMGTLMSAKQELNGYLLLMFFTIFKAKPSDVNDALGYKEDMLLCVTTFSPKDLARKHGKDQRLHTQDKCWQAKKDSDEQVLLAEDQAWIESSSESDQEINANMVFMAKMEKVLSDSEESSSSAEKPLLRYIITHLILKVNLNMKLQ